MRTDRPTFLKSRVSDSVRPTDRPAARSAAKQIWGSGHPTDRPAPQAAQPSVPTRAARPTDPGGGGGALRSTLVALWLGFMLHGDTPVTRGTGAYCTDRAVHVLGHGRVRSVSDPSGHVLWEMKIDMRFGTCDPTDRPSRARGDETGCPDRPTLSQPLTPADPTRVTRPTDSPAPSRRRLAGSDPPTDRPSQKPPPHADNTFNFASPQSRRAEWL